MEEEVEESPSASQEQHQQQQLPLASPRRKPPTKAKKKPIPKKKLAIINEKLSFLSKNLRPVPSLPSPKALADLVLPHEPLFRSLGLWDFATRLDPSSSSPLRRDLLAELLARFDPSDRCSYVLGARVNVTRADLARALSLPVRKKEKPDPSAAPAPLDDAAQGALLGFISDAMVFLEDAAEVPGEVVQAQRMVGEGRAGWVDWAGLVWAMVEKEMAEAPRTGVCYYAAHLQCLIRFQKPKLFEAEEEEVGVDEEMEVEEDPPAVAEECGTEAAGLSLGMRADTTEDTDGVTIGGLSKGEDNVEVDMEDEFHNELASKFPPLERLDSMNLMQETGNHNNLSFNIEQSNGDFLGMGHDIHKNMELDPGPGSSLLFANDHKRTIDEIGNGENRNIHGFHQSNQQPKKFQSDMPWEQTQSVLAFDECIGDMHNLMGNAKMVLFEKEKAFMNSQLQVQYLNGMLQQKEEIIQSLERNMLQERQKRHIEACRLEHELSTLSNVLFNYKKAMKDTRNAFAEYKTKFPPEVEPVLKNCVVERLETGGVVPGTDGLEKTCSTEEEEMHKVAVEMINDFQKNWMGNFAAYHTQVTKSGERLVELHGEVKLLKGKLVEAKDG